MPLDPDFPPTPPPVSDEPRPVVTEGSGLPRNVAAGLACTFPLFGGIVFFLLDRRDAFVRFYCVQSILFWAVAMLVWVTTELAEFMFRPIPILGRVILFLFWLANVVFSLIWLAGWAVMSIKAFMGKEWDLPYVGRLARRLRIPFFR